MKIDKNKLPLGLWFEDDEGNIIPYDSDKVDYRPEGAVTKHISFPLEIREEVYVIGSEHKDGKPDLTWSTHIGGGNQDVLLAMANSGDYTLAEAMALYASCCERCANVLAYKYLNGKDGYEEYSDEWKNCGTVCRFCKEIENEKSNKG